ncbi:MAG: hypothetical protein HOP17_04205 [Acidobacteria bacterium]|nr:hypothetical protein [Acidobacteriota bacterium]
MTKIFVVLLLAIPFTAVPLSAQTYGLPGSQSADPIGYYINQSFWSNKAFQTAMNNSMRVGGRGKSTAKAVPAGATGATSFRQSGYILPKTLAAMNGGDTKAVAETSQLVTKMLDLYRQTAAKDGFPANDLAYAFEYFVVNNYQVYNYLLDINGDPAIARIDDPLARLQAVKVKEQMKVTLTQERVIYDQFRRMLSENAEVKKMTDVDKQQAAELLAVMTGMAYFQFSQGSQSKSEVQLEKGRQTARTNLEKLAAGVSAERIRITNNGLEF